MYLVGKVKGTAGFFRSDDLGVTWVRINDDQHQFGFVGTITGDLKPLVGPISAPAAAASSSRSKMSA